MRCSYSGCSVAKQKAPPENSGGAMVAETVSLSLSNAQPYRPAEAGMMVPVVVRETEHPPFSLVPRRGRSQAGARRRRLAVRAAFVGGAPRDPTGVDEDRIGVALRSAFLHRVSERRQLRFQILRQARALDRHRVGQPLVV